jgi:hypothetical protein
LKRLARCCLAALPRPGAALCLIGELIAPLRRNWLAVSSLDLWRPATLFRRPTGRRLLPAQKRSHQPIEVPAADNRIGLVVTESDETKISNDDIALGLNWYAEIQRCDLPAIASLGEIDPEFQFYFARRTS